MAKISVKAGATSVTVNVFIQDSSSTIGAGLTGLAYNTASLTAYYALPQAASAAITLATLAAVTSSYSSGGFKEIDATNMPGWYRFDIPNAALASGRFSSIHLRGATNMAPLALEIELTAVDNQSATAFVTGINSLAPPTSWNLLSIDGSGRVDVIKVAGTTQTARDIGASVLVAGDLSATMKTSVQTAADAAVTANTLVNAIAGYIDTEVAAIKAKTDNLPASPAAVGSAMTLTSAYDFAKGTVAMTEAYAADGATATPAQMLYMLWSLMSEKNISTTTLTAKKLDGSTTAMTFTLNDATSPTAITRAT